MNIILGLGIGIIGVLVLMGHITLKHKLNSLEAKIDKQKDYWKVACEIAEENVENE